MSKASKTESKPKQETQDDLVNKIVKDYKSSWDYQAGAWHQEWKDMYRLYNSERVNVAYNGMSDTFVPMAYSTIETLVSGTSGDKPSVEYIPTKYEQNTNTEVLNSMFSYYWDLDNWTNKMVINNRNYFLYGTAVMFVYWNIDHPCIQNVALRDFFIDPTVTAINYQTAGFMGHRFLASKAALADEQVINPNYVDPSTLQEGELPPEKNEPLLPKYKNLEGLGDSTADGEQTEKQEQDMFMGSTVSDNESGDQIEVIAYTTLEKVYYVGNRSKIIYESDNYFKQRQQFLGVQNPTGMYPYILDAAAATESQLYGRSSLQAIAKPQELLNDLTNQNIDAASWALDPLMELDPQYQAYIDKIKNVTGAVYPFKPGSLQAVQKPIIPSAVFNERTNIKNEIREATAVDQVLKGVGASGETTATEIKAQVASAGKRFDLVISEMENGGYYRLAKLVFQMMKLYVTVPTMMRVVGKKGVDWQQFDPKQYEGDYEPRVKLRSSVIQDKQRTMRNVKEMYTALLGSPFVEQGALTRLVLEKAFDLEPGEVDELIIPPEKLAEMESSSGKKSDMDPKELINYKDVPPDIQAQMEKAAGYEPSVVHEGRMENMAFQDSATNIEAVGKMSDVMEPQGPNLGQ
ncbi:hypothetical protein H0W80_01080 [Candidatus Saccharibacteria bacterium]|nr:hypothetical protein [Candidatus Saccharibacteria bacterium]